MKKLLKIAVLLLATILQAGCHMSARVDWYRKNENGGKVWKSRPTSSTGGAGNASDRVFRSFFNTGKRK